MKEEPVARAVIYLRVSTASRVEKGEDPDGYSIPAQREACRRKADDLGADVVHEFVDRAESARSAARPALQKMLTFVAEARPEFVIVHKVDRLARNRVDDVDITMKLRAAGTRLVSCNENIDETPSGMLLHGIMSVLAEYYSLNLASEVIKGSIQKAKSGGLPGKAPVGYVNVRHVVDGREIRTVNIDPIRGPLMASAFEQYATGDLGLRQVLKDVTERGLTTVGGPNTPSKPLGLSQLARLFKHPFYKGTVRYKGVEYPGNHTPLVGIALWQQVQDVFVQRQAATEKQRKHNHYVKGSLFCARCESRLIVSKPTNRHGSTYEYFICIGRHPKRTICTMQSLPIDVVEQKVIEMYFREHRTLDRIADLEEVIRDEIARSQQAVERDRAWARRRIQTVKDKQTKLLEAHLADAVPLDILKDQQDRLGADLADAEAILDTTSQTIDNYEGALGSALELIRRLAPAYQLAGPKVRRGFNQAI